jgi:hypothetical protein
MTARILRGVSARRRAELVELLTHIKQNLADVAASGDARDVDRNG